MKIKKILAKIISVTLFASIYIGSTSIPKVYAESGTWNYGYNGNIQTFIAPYTGSYELETWGAQGGDMAIAPWTGKGGRGGYSVGVVSVNAGTPLYVYVGGQGQGYTNVTNNHYGGWNGGGTCYQGASGGGGATDIRNTNGTWNNTTSLNSRIIVAGGGGGSNDHSDGGAGGGLEGFSGMAPVSGPTDGIAGSGGTQTSGGTGWINGSFGVGAGAENAYGDGGAGGGGWYGGGKGNTYYVAGGGGSSYVGGVKKGSTIAGNFIIPSTLGGKESGHTGDGCAKITYVSPTFSISPNASTNSVDMNWSVPDTSQKYSYMLYSKPSTDSTFQTIPAKDKIKVLNIYPNVGNNVKTWMETNGYGKGLISVDEVTTDTFNANPYSYLKNPDGSWKYDVIYEGAWNVNNYKDLSVSGEQAIESFIQAGRGYLCGHDAMFLDGTGYYLTQTNRNKLMSYLNITLKPYTDTNIIANSSVTLTKKGLLTNYPWQIGEVGTNLSVPVSHSSEQYTSGDIWVRYNGFSDVLNNFYLTTWNNTAMIQTGHSQGQATPDEQKLIANTLFYLAQTTTGTSWSDHKGQDLVAPNQTNINGISINNNQFTINYNGTIDNGSTYNYYVEATGENNNVKITSDTKTTTVTTGVKGYAIKVNQNPTGVPDKNSLITGTNYTFNNPYSKGTNFYVHIASVDGAGNMSTVTNYLIDNTAPTLNIAENTTALTEGNITLTATASDSNSGVKYIKTPDGSIINGSTANYVVNKNGTYTFETCDNTGNITTQTINVTNIVYKPTLTATANNTNNCVDLNWDIADDWQKYSYMLYSKSSTDSTFQTIPSKDKIKVLNIYPSVGNNVKTWMETNGYGKGLISVDEVTTDTFNSNPYSYLKDSNGNWKYDVIYEGAWNVNNYKDLSVSGEQAIESFIQAGRGYLCGHDAMFWDGTGYYLTQTNRNKLMSYLNITLKPYINTTIAGTSVTLTKKGLLTNYPWQIGEVGTNLNVPISHTSEQYASGDIWVRYNGFSDVLNNFYLTTWNNTAMIQTGHAEGQATSDEQKLIANTLFYLAQVTSEKTWSDHKGQDLASPNPTNVTEVLKDSTANHFTINYNEATDNGSTYNYYLEATGETNSAKTKSATQTATVTTGVKGYAVKVDQNPTGTPDKNSLVTGTSYTFNNPYSNGTNFYVHVASVDGAGNMSTVTNYLIDNTAPILTINPNTTAWTNSNVVLNITASDSNSGVKNIKLPDGSYVTGNTAQYTVTTNGTYEFESTDNIGNVTKQSITVNNIDKTTPSGTITPNTTNWTNGNVELTAIGSDTQSGVKSITKPDGTVVNADTTTYTANTNGTYDFVITDNVGNTTTKSYTVNNIDKTLPNLKLTLDSDLITNKTVTINAKASDGESGIQSITKPDGSVVNGSYTSYTVDKNNTYTFKATDVAGNVVTVSITVNNIIAINTISGIDHIEYKLEGATVQDWTTYNSLAIVNEGITTIYARAVDKAGNYSDVATSVVKLDRSLPINTTIKIIAS